MKEKLFLNEEYKPLITTTKFNSVGTTAVVKDWKTGRGIQCLSQGEMLWYYILRWDDKNIDIKEQYPLDPIKVEIASDELGLKKPVHNELSTDFLIMKEDGSYKACSIKTDRNLSERRLQLLCIEKQYWINEGADFEILFKADVNMILANNIREVVSYYDKSEVFDDYSLLKHKIRTVMIHLRY